MEADSLFLTLETLRDRAQQCLRDRDQASLRCYAVAYQELHSGSNNLSHLNVEMTPLRAMPRGPFYDVDLHLSTNLAVYQGVTYCPQWHGDPGVQDHFRRRFFVHDGTEGVIFSPAHTVASGLEVIDLTHSWAGNWFHFLIEVLSLLASPEVSETNLKILINRTALSGTFLQAIQALGTDFMDRVIPAGNWGKVECQTLLRPEGIWMPSHYHTDPDRKDHMLCGFTDHQAAQEFYQRIWPNRLPQRLKIIIARPETSITRCTNQQMMIEKFVEDGFHVVTPETLSFEDQVALFYDADVVVGVSGAAFANLVFCRAGTRIVCARDVQSDNVTYEKLAEGFDLDFQYFNAKSEQKTSIPDYSVFEVDIDAMHAITNRPRPT